MMEFVGLCVCCCLECFDECLDNWLVGVVWVYCYLQIVGVVQVFGIQCDQFVVGYLGCGVMVW